MKQEIGTGKSKLSILMASALTLMVLLVLLVFTALMPEVVLAEDAHVHDDGLQFEAWTATDRLPDRAGNYYLTNDVSPGYTWEVTNNITLCLNGHKISGARITGDESKAVIKVSGGAVLDLYDCDETEHKYIIDKNGLAAVDETVGGEGEGKFTGGYITGGNNNNGGAVYVADASTLNQYGGTIIGNKATSCGGGIYVAGGIYTLDKGNIIGNTSGYGGGGVYNAGGIVQVNEGGKVADNTADIFSGGNVYGGGISVSSGGKFTLSGGTISGNSARDGGGGVSVERENSKFTLESGCITGNYAESGGGVFIDRSGNFFMKGGMITDNEAKNGGGVSSIHSNDILTMEGGEISGNTATVRAGGMALDAGTITMTSGKITSNIGPYGGVYVSSYSSFNLLGNPAVYGNILDETNKKSCNIFLDSGSKIIIGGYIDESDGLGVTMKEPGVFTFGWNGKMSGTDPSKRFTSDDNEYYIGISDEGEAQLKKKITISSVEISDITAPVADEKLDTEALTTTENVSLSNVFWDPADEIAAGNTEYTASVTVTPALGYTIADTVTATVNENAAVAVLNADGTLTVTYQFEKTGDDKFDKYKAAVAKAKAKRTTITSAKNKAKRKVALKWKKVSGASKYEIRYSLKKTLKKAKKKTVKSNKATLTKLKKKKTYYIQVRPVTRIIDPSTGKARDVCGKWSKTKKVKIRK